MLDLDWMKETLKEAIEKEDWEFEVVDAGEFDDPDYLRNPVNRCYFC